MLTPLTPNQLNVVAALVTLLAALITLLKELKTRSKKD